MANNKIKEGLFSGFYKLDRSERLKRLTECFDLDAEALELLANDNSLPFELSDLFVENSIGSFSLPFGIVTNVLLNDHEYIVPFAVEESSVIAASSNACKWIKESGGFRSTITPGYMIGQIQILDVAPEKMDEVSEALLHNKDQIISLCNQLHPRLVERGGGTKGMEVKSFPEAEIPFMTLHLLIDTREAMGANLINTACEKVAPLVEKISGARVGLRILSNLADSKLTTVTCKVRPELLSEKGKDNGREIAQKIVEAYVFAKHDPHRAATHNKGIMNGVDPVVIATGNDWRANEAGFHAFACQEGRYQSLSEWRIDENQLLEGKLTLPLQLGTVGGITRLHPTAKFSLAMMGNPTSEKLAQLATATGLASNLAALRALTTTGIQAGHMKLHAKNIALAAGARGAKIELVANAMIKSQNISQTEAERLLKAPNVSVAENFQHSKI
ncbi:hydroxymethylglutaryl-CoA reductase, degradative [bacterium]|nr:hydroxymethylglutaryl-CoA reductase, degradative [bacterium]